MPTSLATSTALSERILDRIVHLVHEAEEQARPLELDPYRSQLFELFVTAEGAGYLQTDHVPDLTADGLCRLLGERWGLADAARSSSDRQAKLPAEHVAKMRLLWSLMRMWMEWTYAWSRWPEFHAPADAAPPEFTPQS